MKKVENFPYCRLKGVYLANNRIRKIDPDIVNNIMNLRSFLVIFLVFLFFHYELDFKTFNQEINLANNEIKDFGDVTPLGCSRSSVLVLTGNPIAAQNYRLFVIHSIPSLRVMDHKRVKKLRSFTVTLRKRVKVLQKDKISAILRVGKNCF